MKDALSYTLPTADYETTYYWKVVPYNDKGESKESKEWHFTTQKDASTAAYPYTQDFGSCGKKLPDGWLSENTSSYGTSRNRGVLDTKGNPTPCLYSMWLSPGETATVTTPEFKLPAGKEMAITFDWVDHHPVDAITDKLGTAKKVNSTSAPTKVSFQVYADGAWKELSTLSQGLDEDTTPIYWINEKFDLSAYAGKIVKFRWVHHSFSGDDSGCGLDNVVIEEKVGDKAIFNKSGWNAGKVNYGKAVASGNKFTLINKGERTLKVKSVSFGTANFTASLAADDEVAPREAKEFSLQFNANDAASTVSDVMTVTFESGYSVAFPWRERLLQAMCSTTRSRTTPSTSIGQRISISSMLTGQPQCRSTAMAPSSRVATESSPSPWLTSVLTTTTWLLSPATPSSSRATHRMMALWATTGLCRADSPPHRLQHSTSMHATGKATTVYFLRQSIRWRFS